MTRIDPTAEMTPSEWIDWHLKGNGYFRFSAELVARHKKDLTPEQIDAYINDILDRAYVAWNGFKNGDGQDFRDSLRQLEDVLETQTLARIRLIDFGD